MLTLCSRRAARGPVCEALGLSGPRGRSAPRRAVTDGQSASGQRGWPADTWRPWHTDCDPIHTGHGPCNLAPPAHGRGGVGRGAGTRCPETKTHSGHSQACERARHMDVSGTRPAHIALIGAPPGTPKATDERQASRARPASAQGGTSEAQPRAVWERRCTVPGEHRPLRGAGTSVWTAGATQRTPGPSRALPPKAKLLQRRLRGESRRKPHRSWGLVSRTHTTTAQRHETDNSLKRGPIRRGAFSQTHQRRGGRVDARHQRTPAKRGPRPARTRRTRGPAHHRRLRCATLRRASQGHSHRSTPQAGPQRGVRRERGEHAGRNLPTRVPVAWCATTARRGPCTRPPTRGSVPRPRKGAGADTRHEGTVLEHTTLGERRRPREATRLRLHRGKRQNRRVRRQEAGEWVSGDGVGSEASFR